MRKPPGVGVPQHICRLPLRIYYSTSAANLCGAAAYAPDRNASGPRQLASALICHVRYRPSAPAATMPYFQSRSSGDTMSAIATLTNHQVRLAKRPVGTPTRDNWSFTSEPVAEPAAGGVLVKTLALSLDPAMRGWMNEGKSYIPPVGIGEVMRAGGIGKVIASNNPKFAVGDLVSARPRRAGVHGSVPEDQIKRSGMFKIDPRMGTHHPVAQRAGHARHDRLLRPARRRPAPAGRDGGGLGRRRRGRPDRRASSPRSRAAAWWASPAAAPSATGWSTNWASTPASTTRPATSRPA